MEFQKSKEMMAATFSNKLYLKVSNKLQVTTTAVVPSRLSLSMENHIYFWIFV
jgi:hypothetical protein